MTRSERRHKPIKEHRQCNKEINIKFALAEPHFCFAIFRESVKGEVDWWIRLSQYIHP
jgi:hypothetical protein